MNEHIDVPEEENVLSESEQITVRKEKLSELQKAGKDPYETTVFDFDSYAKEVHDKFDEYENKTIKLAGRIISKRDMGKAQFADLQDSTGKLQLYIKIDNIGEEAFAGYKKLDIGDIIGVTEIGRAHV